MSLPFGLANRTEVVDWLDEPRPRHQNFYNWAHARLGWNSKVPEYLLNRVALYAANAIARQRLKRGLGLLGRGNVLITDRLHALVLGWMGGMPVFYIDNSYNKLSNFTGSWLKDCSAIVRCRSFEEALESAIAECLPTPPSLRQKADHRT